MSLVYITHHNENVEDYEDAQHLGGITHKQRKLKYVSKHKEVVKKQINQSYITEAPNGIKLITDWGKHERRTMGCARTPLNPPNCFLRKNEGLKWRRLHDHVCPPGMGLAPVPLRSQMEPIKVCQSNTITPRDKVEKQDKQQKIDAPTPVGPSSKRDEPKIEESKTCTCKQENVESSQKQTQVKDCQSMLTPAKVQGPMEQWSQQQKAQQGQQQQQQLEKSQKTETVVKSVQADPRCKRKNFIALNRKRAIQAKTRRPAPQFVDTPHGDRQNLVNSGLIPQFVCGKNFAKVPCYINEHKKLLQEYREKCSNEQNVVDRCEQFMVDYGVHQLTVKERLDLLEGLRINYLEQLKIFQNLSLYTDTPTKKLRKARLEKDLLQLETDIKFLEDNAVIYISDF